MRLTATLLTCLVLAAGCAPGTGDGPSQPASRETTREARAEEMTVEQIAEGQSGPAKRQVVVAGSAAELAAATGLEVPEAGEGLYVSAHAGERPTGGYRVSLSKSGPAGIRVNLRAPGPEDIVTQALTQPYAVAVVSYEDGTPEAGELNFVNAAGQPLGWPVRRVGD